MPLPESQATIQLGLGWVRHHRLRPIHRIFGYPAVFLRLRMDGDAAHPSARALGPVFGWGRWAPIGFDPRDHGDGQGALDTWARRILAEAGLNICGPIWLQCFPRMLGYSFKPVSFWFCHQVDGSLAAVLAEVNNTFGERHVYVLADPNGAAIAPGARLQALKVLHVSPFCRVAGHYTFRFLQRGARTVARVDLHDEQGPLLLTSWSGTLQAATSSRLWRTVLKQPWFTLGVIVRIHLQALRLWWGRVPFYRQPAPPAAGVSRGGLAPSAHRSIAPMTPPCAKEINDL